MRMYEGSIYRVRAVWKNGQVLVDWDQVIAMSPNAIRPSDWPEPRDWFYGWNREAKLVISELVEFIDDV